MKIGKFINIIPTIILEKVVPLVVGAPGIGKSQIAVQIADSLKMDHIILIPSMMMPSDVMGLPFRKNETEADFLPYGFSKQILSSKKPLLVVIDDLIQSTALMQSALMQMVEARILGGKKIPDCVHFIMLTNSAKHGAGGSKILEPLKGRSCILELEVDPKQWIQWGVESGRIEKEILFYIQMYPEALHDFQIMKDIKNSPSPRNWERLSKLFKAGLRETSIYSGCIGDAEATRFAGFLKTFESLRGVIPQIIKEPDAAPLFKAETDLDKAYSLGLALAHNAKPESFSNIYKYLCRMGGEAKEFILAQTLNFHPELKETETYINHICNEKS